MGEGAPRQVISGLVKYVPVEAMRGRLVAVVCNLKAAKMREVMSHGMVRAVLLLAIGVLGVGRGAREGGGATLHALRARGKQGKRRRRRGHRG